MRKLAQKALAVAHNIVGVGGVGVVGIDALRHSAAQAQVATEHVLRYGVAVALFRARDRSARRAFRANVATINT